MLGTFVDRCRRPLVAAAFGAFLLTPAGATTPDRSWLGAKRLLVLTEMRTALGSDASAEDLCEQVKKVATDGAPFPVQCVQLGDPALQADDAAVLLVQASVQDGPGGEQLLVFTARRQRQHGLDPLPILFGTAPRAVPTSAADSALKASLSEILPWLKADETSYL